MFELIVGFLIILAIFDLVVGVSNDAVNFMNSGIGAKAARFRTIMAVSAIGVFAGAAMSNGMMDIARHGILMPEYFTFYEVMCVFLAVMVTDVILLDIFNTLGMPTSTTVSLVFELLGGAMYGTCWEECASTSFDASATFGCTLSLNTTTSNSIPSSNNCGLISSKISVIGGISDATFKTSFSVESFDDAFSSPHPDKTKTNNKSNTSIFFI